MSNYGVIHLWWKVYGMPCLYKPLQSVDGGSHRAKYRFDVGSSSLWIATTVPTGPDDALR